MKKRMTKVAKGTKVTIKHMLGETVQPLVTRLKGDSYRFNCNAYIIGDAEDDAPDNMYFHIRQAREVIPNKRKGNNVRPWPRLRKALHAEGIEPIHIVGGDIPIHYTDEIVIPDFKVSGSHFFVVKKEEINKILKGFPLDEKGKQHAEELKRRKAAAEAEAYRQEHDPKCIAERIGSKLDIACPVGREFDPEFMKITLVSKDGTEFSVMYPSKNTNLIWSGSNVPKILCEAPETGIEYLSGWNAGYIDPKNHHRLRKSHGAWDSVYLMPDPKLATEVREDYRWKGMFDDPDNDGVSPELIATAQKVILEGYDILDRLLKKRFVYDSTTKKVTKEVLHNWPFDMWNKKTTEPFDWRCDTEEK